MLGKGRKAKTTQTKEVLFHQAHKTLHPQTEKYRKDKQLCKRLVVQITVRTTKQLALFRLPVVFTVATDTPLTAGAICKAAADLSFHIYVHSGAKIRTRPT